MQSPQDHQTEATTTSNTTAMVNPLALQFFLLNPYPPLTPTNFPNPLTSPTFNLTTPPKTDLWRKPPTLNVSTAPAIYTPIALSKFKSARVTVTSPWETLYDQGGLAFLLPPKGTKPGHPSNTGHGDSNHAWSWRWLKTGIEFVNERPMVGTVATDNWSDWSLAPLPAGSPGGNTVTIEMEREVDKKTGERLSSLWIYYVDPGTGERLGIRECTWVFGEDVKGTRDQGTGGNKRVTELEEVDSEERHKERVIWVGVYAARPSVKEGAEKEGLTVTFKDFAIELFD